MLGARAYLKPFALAGSDSELLKNLQVGLTVAADTNPYAQAPKGTSGSGSVAAYGVDALAPLFSSDLFSALASADLAMQGSHSGASLGVGGKLLGLFNWGLSNRFLGRTSCPTTSTAATRRRASPSTRSTRARSRSPAPSAGRPASPWPSWATR